MSLRSDWPPTVTSRLSGCKVCRQHGWIWSGWVPVGIRVRRGLPGRTSPQGRQKYCGSSWDSGSCNWATLYCFMLYLVSAFTPIISSQSCEQLLTKTEWKDTLSSSGYFYCFVVATHEIFFFFSFFFCKRDDLTWCKSGFRTQSSFGGQPWVGFVSCGGEKGKHKEPK